MTNKYQEALDKICSECQKLMSQIPTKEHEDSIEIHSCGHTMCPYRTISNDYCEEYDTLQELIDKTTICGLSLDEAIPVIEMYRLLKHTTNQLGPIGDLMMGTKGQYYYDGKHSVEQLEKALDKACEKIQFYDGLFPRSLTTKMSKEEWKEWLLKDE